MKNLKTYASIIKDVDSKGQVVVAANAIGNVDSDEDMSLPGSFNKTIRENFKRVKWFLNHDTSFLVGVPIEAKELANYLQVVGQINMKKEKSRDTYEDYKLYAAHGRTLEHSIGVEATKFKNVNNVRQVMEWKWWEFSTLTNWGANSDTPLLGIKSADALYDEMVWQERRMKEGKYSDEKFKEIDLYLSKLKRSLKSKPDSRSTTYPIRLNVQGKTIDRFIETLV